MAEEYLTIPDVVARAAHTSIDLLLLAPARTRTQSTEIAQWRRSYSPSRLGFLVV